jgi:hypothetical protein
MSVKSEIVVLDWSTVKHQYLDAVREGNPWNSQPAMSRYTTGWHANPYELQGSRDKRFFHDTPAKMLEYLDSGFHAPEFASAIEYVPIAERRVSSWNDEEGEPDAGRLIGGFDDFYLGMSDKPKRPGLRVQIEYCFAASVKPKVIEAYGAWVAGFLGALEATGFDLEVDMWVPLDHLYPRAPRTNILVRVKRQNEVSDFSEWSALFSPGGFRHLGFTAICVACDKKHKQATYSLGNTISGKTWGLEYDRDDQTVRITVNQQAWGGKEVVPVQKLNKEAVNIGLLPDPDGKIRKEWERIEREEDDPAKIRAFEGQFFKGDEF